MQPPTTAAPWPTFVLPHLAPAPAPTTVVPAAVAAPVLANAEVKPPAADITLPGTSSWYYTAATYFIG